MLCNIMVMNKNFILLGLHNNRESELNLVIYLKFQKEQNKKSYIVPLGVTCPCVIKQDVKTCYNDQQESEFM